MDNKLGTADLEFQLAAIGYMERNRPDNLSWRVPHKREDFNETIRLLCKRGLFHVKDLSDGLRIRNQRVARWIKPVGDPDHSYPEDVFTVIEVWDWITNHLKENYDAQLGQKV